MNCPNCKNEIIEGSQFCEKCGLDLNTNDLTTDSEKPTQYTLKCNKCGKTALYYVYSSDYKEDDSKNPDFNIWLVRTPSDLTNCDCSGEYHLEAPNVVNFCKECHKIKDNGSIKYCGQCGKKMVFRIKDDLVNLTISNEIPLFREFYKEDVLQPSNLSNADEFKEKYKSFFDGKKFKIRRDPKCLLCNEAFDQHCIYFLTQPVKEIAERLEQEFDIHYSAYEIKNHIKTHISVVDNKIKINKEIAEKIQHAKKQIEGLVKDKDIDVVDIMLGNIQMLMSDVWDMYESGETDSGLFLSKYNMLMTSIEKMSKVRDGSKIRLEGQFDINKPMVDIRKMLRDDEFIRVSREYIYTSDGHKKISDLTQEEKIKYGVD